MSELRERKVPVSEACETLAVPRPSYYRWRRPAVRRPRREPVPSPRALAPEERRGVLEMLHAPRFVDRSPAAVVATLLEEGQVGAEAARQPHRLDRAARPRHRCDLPPRPGPEEPLPGPAAPLTLPPRDRSRPISGSGSCARCQETLGLASLKRGDVWYCSSNCAEGRVSGEPRQAQVPEEWLTARPRRFFGARRPKELKAS